MPYSRAYLNYHHCLGQKVQQGTATPVERTRHKPALTQLARGQGVKREPSRPTLSFAPGVKAKPRP